MGQNIVQILEEKFTIKLVIMNTVLATAYWGLPYWESLDAGSWHLAGYRG